jgi:hypothetical protein
MVIAHADKTRLVLPVESVVAVLEVRSRLDKRAIKDACAKTTELAKLGRKYSSLGLGGLADPPPSSLRIGGRQEGPLRTVVRIPIFLIGFNSISAKSVGTEWHKYPDRPDIVACLGKFLIAHFDLDEEPMLIEAPHAELSLILGNLTGHILRLKTSNVCPDLIEYFKVPTTKTRSS